MSSPAAGKFQDHYKILGIDAKATLDVVQMAFNALKNVYDPTFGTEPDRQKLEEITLALEVLSDPVSRKMFDSVRGGDDDREISFSGMEFFSSLPVERDRRMTMLCILYDVRRQNPRVPVVTMRQFEKIVTMTEDQIQMCLWYLKTLGLISVDDKSKMQITAQGMEFLEENPPDPKLIWPHLKNPSGPRPEPGDLANLSSALTAFGSSVSPAPNAAPAPVPQPAPAALTDAKIKPISLIRRTQVAITEA